MLVLCVVRGRCLFADRLEAPHRETTGVEMDSLLSTPSNILFAKRIFFPASFALVADVAIILDGAA